MAPNLLDTFDTFTLSRMIDRAYRDAARSWDEYRAAVRAYGRGRSSVAAADPAVRMLRDAAVSAEDYWRHLYDAREHRVRAAER